MKGRITFISFLLLLLAACPVYGLYLAEESKQVHPSYAEGEVLVKFKKGVISTEARSLASSYVMSVAKEFMFLSQKRGQTYLLLRSEEMTTEEMIEVLKKDPGVEEISPNYIRRICETFPNDPKFDELWGLHAINAAEAWDINTGSPDVVVAVIDTGVDYTHGDLTANMWINDAEATGTPSVDDDSNGYVDDIYGYDFASDNYGNNDSDPMDISGHGTHVAGTIGAVGNNNTGVVGVNWNVKIMALKAERPDGYLYDSDIIEAIEYLVYMKTNYGVDVVAINASYGGTSYNGLAKDAIESAGDAGIVFVAAAGNDGTDNDMIPHYPCAHDSTNIICVAATDHSDGLASFSNYGVISVDLGAPGVSIKSTVPFGMDTEASVTVDSTTYQAIGMEYASQTDGITSLVYDCGLGYPGNFPPEVSGNIALIERGEIYFSEKTTNAQNAGAVAVVIYNNEPGNFSGTLGDPGDWVPVVSISQEDGRDLIDNQGGLPRTITLVNKISNYGTKSGTSMAAPHVTGAAGLMAAEYPNEDLNQRIDRILSGVDVIPSLSGEVATEGRLNLANSISGGQSFCSEDDAGNLDIAGANGNTGSQATHTVRIQDAPNMVDSLGFEVTFDPDILEYMGYNRGDCVADFDFFDCTEPSPGVVRCGGFEGSSDIILQGIDCNLVNLQFTVFEDPCESGTCPGTLGLQALVDDLAGWSTSQGCFCCGCSCDVNGDGRVTPEDALCAFRKYMGICPTGCGECENVCCDVNGDNDCTPGDALCIFREYLGIGCGYCG